MGETGLTDTECIRKMSADGQKGTHVKGIAKLTKESKRAGSSSGWDPVLPDRSRVGWKCYFFAN